MRNIYLFLFTLCCFPSVAWSGAWVPEVGSGYFKLGANYFEATDRFGDNDGFEEFTSESITLYGEVGLLDDLGLFVSAPFQDLEQTFDGDTTSESGLGDVEVGLRYKWFAEPFVFSTAFTVKIPEFYDQDAQLPLGNGQYDYELRALIGRSLGDLGYFGIEGGYRLRADEPSDEYRYLVEYGFSAGPNLYFRTKLDGIATVGNASNSTSSTLFSGNNLSITPEFDLGKLELTTGWNFNDSPTSSSNLGIEFTFTEDLYGDDALDGRTFQLALTYQL